MTRNAVFFLAFIASGLTVSAQVTRPENCPTITVTGPAGVSMPYDPMTFRVSLTGDVPPKLTFHWDVTGGAIMGGQGTHLLQARYESVHNFKATVTVSGLPSGCPMIASEILHMTGPEPDPEHLGAINNAAYLIDTALLKTIDESLTLNTNSQLYVWMYVGSSSERKVQSLKSRLLQQLAVTNINPSRITLMVSAAKARGAIFWHVPPGSPNPAP